jgi:HlyD family secretion protein
MTYGKPFCLSMKHLSRLKSIPRAILKRWKIILVLLVVLAGIGFWQWRQMEAKRPKLTFIKPEVSDLTKTLQVSGVVDAKEKASMRFAAGGKLTYLGAKEGDTVKKNQTLARIDGRELQKRLQQDLNNYMTERWDFEDTQDATDYHLENQATRKDIDQQQWSLHNTVLDVEIRDIAIQNTVLSAPFSGLLVGVPSAVTGVNLTATDIFELINPATLVFKAAVDEADIGSVAFGQAGSIELDSFPDQPFMSDVQAIAYRSSQNSSGTVFVVELPLAEATRSANIRLGMNGDVSITLQTKPRVLSIPLDATRQRDGQTYVDVRTGEFTYEERMIKTGLETDERIEVVDGLTTDQEILLPE